MNLFIILRIAYRALARHRLRSLLTMLGIIIGVGAVIAMIALGQGARNAVQAQIASLGSNVIMIFPGTTTQGGVRWGMGTMTTLSEADAAAIRKECPSVALVSETVRAIGQVVYGNQNWSTLVQGASPEFFTIREWQLQSGTIFTDSDVRGASKVCVLGATVAELLFGDQDPVGAVVRIKQIPFKVVGVLARKGGTVMGSDQDDLVVAPYTTVQKKILGITYIGAILTSATSSQTIPQAIQEVTALLRQRHRIQPGQDDDFTLRSQIEFATAQEAASRTMTMLLGSIASVSLLVGGIGIMNIMLVSVTERTREIGIRMAVGARSRDILFQFLIEAIVLSVLGGVVGIALGIAGSSAISAMAQWATQVSPGSILLAFFFSAAVGVFFGFYPAQKAARLDPIEALRYE